MKILHVSKKYPQALGGDAIVVANLQKQQQAAGHEVVIVTSNCDEIASNKHIYKVGLKDTPSGLDSITIRRVISLVILLFKMFKILDKERPDVIHTHSVDMAFFTSFAARRFNIPIIHTFHIVTFYDANQPALRRKSELWLAKKTKPRRVTAPNTYDVKKLRAAGLRQTVWLPNGVDLTEWEPQGYTEKNRKFTFVAVGRLEPQKGYDHLIKATATLVQTLPHADFQVIIIGEGSQEAALNKLVVDLGVGNIVSLLGRKNQKEIHALLSEADAAVLPSLYETTPLTLLEAWAAALPVVATSVGILRETPPDFNAAYIVPPKDDLSLVEAMGWCMTDETARAVIAAKGHEEVKKYTWPAVTQAAEAIYQGWR